MKIQPNIWRPLITRSGPAARYWGAGLCPHASGLQRKGPFGSANGFLCHGAARRLW